MRKNITIKGRIEFNADALKEYSRDFTAILTKSGAFNYGNGTGVYIEWGIMANGKLPTDFISLDTRYERGIDTSPDSFKAWLTKYLKNNYEPHVLSINKCAYGVEFCDNDKIYTDMQMRVNIESNESITVATVIDVKENEVMQHCEVLPFSTYCLEGNAHDDIDTIGVFTDEVGKRWVIWANRVSGAEFISAVTE